MKSRALRRSEATGVPHGHGRVRATHPTGSTPPASFAVQQRGSRERREAHKSAYSPLALEAPEADALDVHDVGWPIPHPCHALARAGCAPTRAGARHETALALRADHAQRRSDPRQTAFELHYGRGAQQLWPGFRSQTEVVLVAWPTHRMPETCIVNRGYRSCRGRKSDFGTRTVCRTPVATPRLRRSDHENDTRSFGGTRL